MRVLLEHMRLAPCFALAFATVVGCSQSAGPNETAPPASAPPAAAPLDPLGAAGEPSRVKGPVIATIVTHDAKVSIVGHGGDLRVVLRKLDGTLVADGVTLAELETKDPDAARLVRNATAGVESGYVDATYRAPRTNAPAIDATLDR